MKKIVLFSLLMLSTLLAYDFGDVPEKKLSEIKKDRPLMVMIGKTECIWCESMAPQIKEIKEEYPKTLIYYTNTDKDIVGTITHNIVELPVQIFYGQNGKELDRHVGYINKEDLLEYLKHYGVLKK